MLLTFLIFAQTVHFIWLAIDLETVKAEVIHFVTKLTPLKYGMTVRRCGSMQICYSCKIKQHHLLLSQLSQHKLQLDDVHLYLRHSGKWFTASM